MTLFSKLEAFFEKYERHISSLSLVGGFIFDSFTIRRIDFLFENLTIIFYLVLSGISIVLFNYFREYPTERTWLVKVRSFLPFFIQFAFGGLFSAFFIFYTRSATLGSSWSFVFILLFLLVGNEFFKNYYERIVFQTSIYFIAIFSFFIFFVPVMISRMGSIIFLLSGLVSLVFIILFSKILKRFTPLHFDVNKKNLSRSVLSIFVVINILYFTNLIPPIPLALKDAGIYYSVQRIGDDYLATGRVSHWYDRLSFLLPPKILIAPGQSLYAFSSVFAPTDLNVEVVHNWQHFDSSKSRWVTTTKIAFPIRGGRDAGYRGFSKKESLAPGLWRVNVETERGQVIGRVKFRIEESSATPETKEELL